MSSNIKTWITDLPAALEDLGKDEIIPILKFLAKLFGYEDEFKAIKPFLERISEEELKQLFTIVVELIAGREEA